MPIETTKAFNPPQKKITGTTAVNYQDPIKTITTFNTRNNPNDRRKRVTVRNYSAKKKISITTSDSSKKKKWFSDRMKLPKKTHPIFTKE